MASTNNFYSSTATKRGARPPPPKPTTTATARRPTAGGMSSRPKPSYQSNRSVPSSTQSGGHSGSKAVPSRGSTSAVARGGGTLSGSRKAPIASRPVGSYYNSSATAGNRSMGTGAGAANPYASSAPTPATTAGTTDTTDNDNWDDWGSPAKSSATNIGTSSWAAPAPAPNNASATNVNDWYSAGGSTTNASSADTGYTTSGFTNQSSQPQQHQTSMQPGSGFYQNNNTQQQEQQPFLSGAMDSSAPTMSAVNHKNNAGMTTADGNAATNGMPSFSMFMPSAPMQQQPYDASDPMHSIENEAPLLEELGINIQHILLKTKAVVFPFSRFGGDQIDPVAICQDSDLPGAIALLLLLGGEMVLTGKLQFGYIYIYGLTGCIFMTLLVNLISPTDAVSFWTVTSIMGYALLPVNILALVKIFVMDLINMQTFGKILGALTVLWSTMASARLLELGCGLRDQRMLIMYPLLLFYSAFVMMTIL